MEHTIVRDGARIAYRLAGKVEASAPRFALVHSLAMDHSFWNPVVQRLQADFGLLAIDARGHGRSDKPAGPYTVEQMAQDLDDVLVAVGWNEVYVAGASMGGCIAFQFAATNARALGACLIDTTAWYGTTAAQDWAARAARAQTEGLAALVEFQKTRWFSDGFRLANPETVERCVELFLTNDVQAFSATCQMLGAFDGRPLMAQVKAPTAIIVGEEDYAAPVAMAQALQDGIKGATLTVISDARHLTPLETPDVVAEVLRVLASSSVGKPVR